MILIAATNRPDMLDPALLRPGRLDRTIGLERPTEDDRLAILKLLAREVDLDGLAKISQGFSGADLENVLNEAALLATRAGNVEIGACALDDAYERVVLGVASRRHVMSGAERRIVAVHEAGHALVGLTLPTTHVPRKVSIIPRGATLGAVWNGTDEERTLNSRTELLNRMAVMLGGHTAENLVCGEPSSAASNDLARATGLAREMVCKLGMTEALGNVSYGDVAYGTRAGPGYSDLEKAAISREVRRFVDEACERARDVLAGSRATLGRITDALLEHETITAEDLDELVTGVPLASRARS